MSNWVRFGKTLLQVFNLEILITGRIDEVLACQLQQGRVLMCEHTTRLEQFPSPISSRGRDGYSNRSYLLRSIKLGWLVRTRLNMR